MGYVGFEFITQSDRGEFAITIEMPAGYSLDETNFTALYIEQLLHDFPETERVFSSVGVSNEGFIGQTSTNAAEFNVTLKPKSQRNKTTDQVGMQMKKKYNQFLELK